MIEQGAQLVSKRSLWYQRSVSSQVGEQTKQFNLRAESKVTQGDTTQRERKIWLSVVDCVSSRGKLSPFRALNSFFYLCGKNKWLTEVFTRMWPHPTLTFDLVLNQGKSHLSAYAAKTLVILDCSRRLDRKSWKMPLPLIWFSLFFLSSYVRDATVAMIISFSLFVFPSERPRIFAPDGSGESGKEIWNL